jgi:hypothetical protein
LIINPCGQSLSGIVDKHLGCELAALNELMAFFQVDCRDESSETDNHEQADP